MKTKRNLKLAVCCFLTLTLLSAFAYGLYYLNAKFLFGYISYGVFVFVLTAFILLFNCSTRLKLCFTLILLFIPFLGAAFLIYVFVLFSLRGRKRKKVGLYVDKREFLNKSQGKIYYYNQAANGWADFLKTLKSAKEVVYIYSYIVKAGERLNQLTLVLFGLLKRGVKVRLGGDWFGSGPFYKDETLRALKNAGAKIICFREPKLFLAPWDNVRAHSKVALIDGKTLFLSSANIEDKSVDTDKNYCLKVNGGLENFEVFSPLFCGEYKDYKNDDNNLKFFLTRTKDQIRDGLITMIWQSQKSLDVVTPYLSFDKETGDSLERAVKRGVKIRFFIPKLNERGKKDIVTNAFCLELLEKGVEVYRFTGGFLHSKILLSDQDFLMLGSANFDLRSSSFAVESLAFSTDNRLIAQVLEDFDEILLCSVKQKSLKLTPVKKLAKKLASAFGPLV